jgi:hypothetical protein
MIFLDVVHPPAVATAMSFALRAEEASNLVLFALALAITAVLVALQRAAVWALLRFRPTSASADTSRADPADARAAAGEGGAR